MGVSPVLYSNLFKSNSMLRLINGTCLTEIPYSDKPLPLGGKIQKLTHEEFKNKFNCVYSESLHGNPDELTQKYLQNKELHLAIKSKPDLPDSKAIEDRLKNPLDCLVICNMGPEVGHGLFAATDIARHTILCLYAGNIEKGKVFEEGDSYGYLWGELNAASAKMIVTSLNIGGLARFMQHAPIDHIRYMESMKKVLRDKFGDMIERKGINLENFVREMMVGVKDHELDDITFINPADKKQLATCNVKVSQVMIGDVPATVCWAEYDITKHEQICFSYGERYWRHNKPRYFTTTGLIMPLSAYTIKTTIISTTPDEKKATKALIESKLNLNPVVLYQEAVKIYNEKNYPLAKDKFDAALKNFQKKDGDSIACGNCYSGLASCYREMKEFIPAIDHCEKALLIFYNRDKDKLEKLISKYNDCLKLSGIIPKSIYDQAVDIYKNKKEFLPLALYKLLFVLPQFSNELQQASCHSTIASCYEKLSQFDKAIEHIEKALDLRKIQLGDKHELTQHAKSKLNELKQKILTAPSPRKI